MLTQLVNLSIKSSPAERCEIPTRVLLRYQEHVALGRPSVNGVMLLVKARMPGVSRQACPQCVAPGASQFEGGSNFSVVVKIRLAATTPMAGSTPPFAGWLAYRS